MASLFNMNTDRAPRTYPTLLALTLTATTGDTLFVKHTCSFRQPRDRTQSTILLSEFLSW